MSYDPANRLTTSIQGSSLTTFGYDNAGNKTRQNAMGALSTFSFDPENRLVSLNSSSGLSTYNYQGYNGLRRSLFEPGKILATLVWDGSDYLQERS
jgi:YD repeat-containing protein